MTKIENIVNLLAKEVLTSKQITERLGNITSDIVCVYLNKLLKEKVIERTNDKKPYKYKKSMTPIELLKFSNDFFKENIEYLLKNPKIKEFILSHEEFDKIEEVFS